jgi:hypothetical protein
MIRRFAALALWTYFAWYLGAMVAAFTDGPSVVGPVAGLLTASVAVYGWLRSSHRNTPATRSLEASPSR